MQAEALLQEIVSQSADRGWRLTTHEAIKTVSPAFDKASEGVGFKDLTEYAVRKMAFSPLCQEFCYYYYVGDHKIWHKNRVGHFPPHISMVSLSPRLVKHMLARNKPEFSCFAILNADMNLAFLGCNDLAKAVGPGILMSLRTKAVSLPYINVALAAFSEQDPFPDYRAKYAKEMG